MKPAKAKIQYGTVDLDESYLDPANHKVRVTTYLDGDVLAWLRKEAQVARVGYQTLLNAKLRKAMDDSNRQIKNSADVKLLKALLGDKPITSGAIAQLLKDEKAKAKAKRSPNVIVEKPQRGKNRKVDER